MHVSTRVLCFACGSHPQGPFFLGKDLSLVDITFVSMMERMVASLAYYKGFYVRGQGRWPAIEAWFNAFEQRPTYMGTKSDYYTHCHDLPPQLGGEHLVRTHYDSSSISWISSAACHASWWMTS